MKVTVVGCSGSFPGPWAACSCYLVEADDHRLLLDLGSGAFGPLQTHIDPARVDAVVLTHLHYDHCVDLAGYYVYRRYREGEPLPRLPVYGPAGTAEAMATLVKADDLRECFDFRVLAAGTTEVGPVELTAALVDHPIETYGLRLRHNGATLAYTADSGPCAALGVLADRADLLLAEASFLDGRQNPAGLHLTGGQAGALAAEAHVARLVVTHVPPWTDAAANLAAALAGHRGDTVLASPGAVYQF